MRIFQAIKTRQFMLLFVVTLFAFTLLTNIISIYGLIHGELIIPETTQIDAPLFVLIFSFLFAISIKLNIDNYKSKKCPISKKGTITASAIISLFASACPICPSFLLSLLGVTASASLFPFGGYEVKITALAIGAISVYLAAKQ